MRTNITITIPEENAKYLEQYQEEIQKSHPNVTSLGYTQSTLRVYHNGNIDENSIKSIISSFSPNNIVFDEQKVKRDLFFAFQNELAEIKDVYPFISDLLKFRDKQSFTTLKQFILKAKQANLISDSQIKKFKQVLKMNNFDLDKIDDGSI